MAAGGTRKIAPPTRARWPPGNTSEHAPTRASRAARKCPQVSLRVRAREAPRSHTYRARALERVGAGWRGVATSQSEARAKPERSHGGAGCLGSFVRLHARVRGPGTPATPPPVPRRATPCPAHAPAGSTEGRRTLPQFAAPRWPGQRRGVANNRSYVGHEALTLVRAVCYTTVHEGQHEAVG